MSKVLKFLVWEFFGAYIIYSAFWERKIFLEKPLLRKDKKAWLCHFDFIQFKPQLFLLRLLISFSVLSCDKLLILKKKLNAFKSKKKA